VTSPASVLHLVARLNVGGPAIQVIPLVHALRRRGIRADVAHGQLAEGEASMTYLADARGLETILVPQLRRAVGAHDAIALRWGGRRDGSEFGTPAGARAQQAALRRLADAGRAGIVLLRLDSRPIGFQIWMTVGDTMYLHRSGVDPSAMRFSPGLIAMRRAIAHGAAELGTRHVEMQGAGDRYKLDLASRIQPISDAYSLARTPVGAVTGATLAQIVRMRRRLREVEVLRRVYLEGPRSVLRKRPP
jgi:hypothetical protein